MKTPVSLARHVLAIVLLTVCSLAQAQIVDHISVTPHEHDAEIVIQFAPKILYLRHTPLHEGKDLRVFIRLLDADLLENDLAQETVSAPKTDRVPDIKVTYPELVNGMLVAFSRSTSFTVRPGTDGRSIVITVPLLPPAKTAPIAPPPEKKPAEVVSKVVPPAPPAAIAAPLASKPAEAVVSPAKESVPAEVAPAPASAPVLSTNEVETRAKAYMEDARRAMAAKDSATAVNRLNRVLGLPSSSQTESAQAMIGEAREMNGEMLKARAEYELYLKLFPAGPHAKRVRERLAALPSGAALARSKQRPLPLEAGPAEWTFNGSISSYYYTGKSQIETLVPPPPGQLTFNRDTLSMVDQNSLITSINLNARRRDAFRDTRIVVRDTDNHNYLTPSRSYNRLYSAYIDHNDRKAGYYVRAGRQNPNGMGVMDRFDGLQAGYNLNPEWRVNGVYGDAVEFNSPFKKTFYGASVDLLPQVGLPGVSVYAIEQTLDGMANRRAFGTELRYFDGRVTAYGMLDYDVLYKGVNIAMLQANYLSEGGDNYFMVIDHRRAPSYSLTNALPAAPGLTLQEMVALQGLDQVRAQAVALTAMSDMFAIGVTHPLTENWQIGADYRLSSISSTLPVMAVLPLAQIGTCLGTIDPVNNTCVIDTASQQASGKNHVLSFQTVGTNLFYANAVGVANLSLIQGPTYVGQALSLGYAIPFWERWRLDANLRYYTQKDDSDNKQDRISPSLKLAYQWRSRLFLEGEIGREVSNSTGPARDDHTTRDYMYVGVRWDIN
ncbi:hypothetical protein SKTS_13250 [Sulfurimicrobium lacus]|uniref:Uncharacterized protein n=1 Tax=Sulfurimicrobium lacus TaxID=2715678 RepID=A0A6F8VCH6_9PROT|nr:hypothetical protein [Sulfurimicrobium lacus]BCB26439.1 hypothetical protein SKTS_13250 [Sulfurimicrobium lacus]